MYAVPPMPKADIRNHVRRLREERGISQTEFARRCGCTRQTIIMLEQERYVPSLSLAFSVAKTLDVPLENVFEPVEPRD